MCKSLSVKLTQLLGKQTVNEVDDLAIARSVTGK
jgi:hypothetical protein